MYKFVSMNKEYANEMIENWKYEAKYNIYDYVNEKEDLLDQSAWGHGKFAVLNQKNELVGELTIAFFEKEDEASEDDGFIKYDEVMKNSNNDYELWIGWGLKPELCGKGNGKEFVEECIKFAVNKYSYLGEYIRCGVAEFNKRAIKVYKRLDFKIFNKCTAEILGKEYKIVQMRKKIND